MVEQAVQAAAVCVVAALLALTVKRGSGELALLLSLGATAAVLLALSGTLGQLADFFRRLGAQSGLPQGLLAPRYKTAAIAVVVTAGAVCALGAALPLLEAVVGLVTELMP